MRACHPTDMDGTGELIPRQCDQIAVSCLCSHGRNPSLMRHNVDAIFIEISQGRHFEAPAHRWSPARNLFLRHTVPSDAQALHQTSGGQCNLHGRLEQ